MREFELISKLKKQLTEELETLSEPLNLEGLEKAGVILKKGDWYAVRNLNDLPDSAKHRITATKKAKDGLRVKLMKDSTVKRLKKKLAKIEL
jgi:hypothetical protein